MSISEDLKGSSVLVLYTYIELDVAVTPASLLTIDLTHI
jgi:hypothetical protein